MGVYASGSLLKIGWIIALRRDRCGPGLAGIIFKIINLKSITEKLLRSAAQPWISVFRKMQQLFFLICQPHPGISASEAE